MSERTVLPPRGFLPETLEGASAAIVNYHHRLPLTQAFSSSTLSSVLRYQHAGAAALQAFAPTRLGYVLRRQAAESATGGAVTEGRRSVVDVLTHDHREVEGMFVELEKLPPGAGDRRDVVDQVTMELVRHAVAEEQYLYPAARKLLPDGDQVADKELRDHAKVEETLKELERFEPSDAEFDTAALRLMALVREHVQDEEANLFPRLAAAAGPEELLDLGDKVTRAKKLAPTRAHPAAPDTPPLNKLLAPGAGLVDRVRDALSGRGRD